MTDKPPSRDPFARSERERAEREETREKNRLELFREHLPSNKPTRERCASAPNPRTAKGRREARELIDVAMPPPWIAWKGPIYPTFQNGRTETIYAVTTNHPKGQWDEIWVARFPADAKFIAAAREGWPKALDEIERLRGKLKKHGKHPDYCVPPDLNGNNGDCACGLDAALSEKETADG